MRSFWCTRRGSNPQPSASEADTLSNCATSAYDDEIVVGVLRRGAACDDLSSTNRNFGRSEAVMLSNYTTSTYDDEIVVGVLRRRESRGRLPPFTRGGRVG